MRTLRTEYEIEAICKALISPTRLQMLRIIAGKRNINLNELAEACHITNGAVTHHIKILQEANLIELVYSPGIRGSQKNCTIKDYQFVIDVLSANDTTKMYETEIPVGTFSRYKVYPTCGIASTSKVIGEVDSPRYFDDPCVRDAGILWFTKGFIEYRIPNYLESNHILKELQFSFEIGSEAPGICENWPSDIYFSINETQIGYWTSPGDFGETRGLFTPDWWDKQWNSYGLLKLLVINDQGTFIDGGKISDVTISSLHIKAEDTITLQISVPETASNIGGCTIFGKGFGNYNQDIKVRALFIENE
ncbi:MAG: helix-turn-helix domain-containing protein [Treponema sp.]|nr:helix-turn-helix domain-containing protein [Treponema sp.]